MSETSSSSNTLTSQEDQNSLVSVKRNRPGTKLEDINNWEHQEINEFDSSFEAQQYLQQLIKEDNSDVKKLVTLPKGQDIAVWQYEHLRQFVIELNLLVVKLDEECTKDTCEKMRATDEWLYLCAAHKEPKECCAIDYIIHTLDGTSAMLNNNKWFGSRVTIKQESTKYFSSIARRLYRIFAHAYFHHKKTFDEFEAETYLCERFVAFSRTNKLIPRKLMIIKRFSDKDGGKKK